MKYLLLITSFLITYQLSAQESQDSTSLTEKAAPKKKIGMLDMFTGNPGRAALYSALLPGAGQAYNKKYWKIPLVLAAEGTAIGFIIYNNRTYQDWRDAHIAMSADPTLTFGGATTPGQAKSQRDKFEGWRDNTILATAAIHLIQIADAFVNRHLMEFDVSDDLSFSIKTNGLSYGLVVTF